MTTCKPGITARRERGERLDSEQMSWHLASFPDLLHCKANVANLPVVPVARAEPARATLTSSPSTRSFVICIHETGRLALKPTPRRTCPSSGSRSAAVHSGTRTTRSFERERHCPLDDATPEIPEKKDLRVYRSRKPYTNALRQTCTWYSRVSVPPEQRRYAQSTGTLLDPARERFPKSVL